MNFSEQCFRIFEQATEAYHVTDNVDATVHNPYAVKSIGIMHCSIYSA